MLWQKESHRVDALYTDLFQWPSIERIYNDYQESNTLVKNKLTSQFKKSASKALEYRQEGNKAFAEKKWVDATEWYNKAMCFVDEGSELMGIAYANRSSCFFNMKMYSKCLVDIEHAKQNNYPQEKMAKLDERVAICLHKMEKEIDQSDAFEPKLDYEPNEMYPCFANVVHIEHNHEYGRHIVAKEDIDVGKTVMVDESYFAETIDQKYRRCSICMRMAENLKPCEKCTFAMFCPRCEDNIFHNIECEINPTFFGSLEFMSFRVVVVRSILLGMKTFPDIDQLMAFVEEMLLDNIVEAPESLSDARSMYRAFFKLQSYPQAEVDASLPQKIYLIYRMLIDQSEVSIYFRTEAHKRFLAHLIGTHVVIIKNWCRNDKCEIGQTDNLSENIKIYLEHRVSIPASYFNHSCIPNSFISSRNGINTCIVIRPIKKGEQLCVTYDENIIAMSKTLRQQSLLKYFKFKCKCDRCLQPQLESSCDRINLSIQTDPSFHRLMDVHFLFIQDNRNYNTRNYQEILSMYAQALDVLKKHKNDAWSRETNFMVLTLHIFTLIEAIHCSDDVPHIEVNLNVDVD